MTDVTDTSWTRLWPPLPSKPSRDQYVAHARSLAVLLKDVDSEDDHSEELIDQARRAFINRTNSSKRSDRRMLLAAGLVLTDLAAQGWQLRVRRERVEVRPPLLTGDLAMEKLRIRRQELVKRDAQLRQVSVRRFIQSMERPRLVGGKFVSILSLMRDGRELVAELRTAREHNNNGWVGALAKAVDPYIEFVGSDEAVCAFTGLRLMDIWRYFRHTWSNQYTSVPGRSMMFIIRDRAAPFHPVMGIGALSSPVMQIRERDTWIGWHPDAFLARIKAAPTAAIAKWLVGVVDTAIEEIYAEDLIVAGVLAHAHLVNPDEAVIERLFAESAQQRRHHHRYTQRRDLKGARSEASEADHWNARARTHLFRSKRALALASYLRARAVFNSYFGSRPTAVQLTELVASREGSDAVRRVIKKAKADRIGIAVADISVCGAVQPYNAILGGKLVAMLASSPEVVLEYRRRYSKAESEIASSMAGRAIVRKPTLVLLGTTSLYGVGSSQYNRIKIPCDRVGGLAGEAIRYEELGHSEAFGTSQYSDETVDALAAAVQESTDGQRVNSIFGEGISPKLRKVRQGLDLLNFPSALLLRHHRRRVVYAVSLVRNLHEHLLGLDPKPSYLVPAEDGKSGTASIAAWWRERWLRGRIASDEVLAEVARHTLVRPINHGARVVVPAPLDQQLLFAD